MAISDDEPSDAYALSVLNPESAAIEGAILKYFD